MHCSGLLYPCTLQMKFTAIGFYRSGEPDMAPLTVTSMIGLMAPSHNIPSFAQPQAWIRDCMKSACFLKHMLC